MLQINTKQTLRHFAIIAFLALLAMSYSFFQGLPAGNDLVQHYQFAQTIHQSITNFEIYPHYDPNINQTYGDYAIRFYPPFGYYILATLYILIGNWYWASLVTFFLVFLVSGIGAYLWAKEEYSPNHAILASAIFIFAPHHLNQIYNNFLFAEFVSSAIIPFCFLFITRICRRGNYSDVIGLAVSYSLLLITHLPLTIIGSIAFAIYGLLSLRKGLFINALVKLAGAVGLGLVASSFYWLRMISEINWVNHSTEEYVSGTFKFSDNFLFTPNNILNSNTDVSVLWLADLMLLAVLLISIPSVYLLIKERAKLSQFTIATASLFFFSVFMTTPLSSFIWNNLEFLQKVQFPWRWLGIVSISGAIFVVKGIIFASEKMEKNKNPFLSLGLGFVLLVFIFSSAFIVKQAYYLPREAFDKQIDQLATQSSFDCWWMVWMKSSALSIKEKAIADAREIQIVSWERNRKKINVSAGNATKMRIALFYYPHWQAEVNNQKVEIEKADDGAIIIPLTGEKSEVKLDFVEPFFIRIANYAAILVWLLFGTFSVYLIVNRTKI